MKRRGWLVVLGLVILVAIVVASLVGVVRKRERVSMVQPPLRIVLILVDALRADRLPFYGNPRQTAPFLSQLAAEGAVFEHAYAASTWTSSSVASLFTGLYPNQHQVLTGYYLARRSQVMGNRPLELNRIPDAVPTLPELIRRLSYQTFGVANNPNIGEPMGFSRGFDHFANRHKWSAEVVSTEIEGWADELRAAQKYFLYLHFMDTHKPYVQHDPWFDPNEKNPDLARYDSSIGFVDSKIHAFFDLLGWNENTLIVLLADHGEEFGDHGGEGHHNKLYAELLHVPLVFWWRGAIEPRRVPDPVSLIDVLPTLEQLASGGAPQTPSEGKSLVPLLEGESFPERTLFSMRWTETLEPPLVRKAVLRDRWKYILSQPGNGEELFDMVDDPRDKRNVISQQREIAVDLRGELERFEANAPRHERAYAQSKLPASQLEKQLRSLGYVQ